MCSQIFPGLPSCLLSQRSYKDRSQQQAYFSARSSMKFVSVVALLAVAVCSALVSAQVLVIITVHPDDLNCQEIGFIGANTFTNVNQCESLDEQGMSAQIATSQNAGNCILQMFSDASCQDQLTSFDPPEVNACQGATPPFKFQSGRLVC